MSLVADRRYSAAAVVLHWAIAAFILFNLITGSFMEGLRQPTKHVVVSLHNSSGLTILLLSLVRIALRLSYRPPPLEGALSPLERVAAKAVHAVLYVMMIAMPLAGWAITSSSTRKTVSELYLLTPLPKIGFLVGLPNAQKDALHDQFVLAHQTGAWILLALLVAHVGGALKHQFLDRRPQLARMWFS